MKDKHFIDWESDTFGFGYGTGEEYTLKALKDFLKLIEVDGSYDHKTLESELGATICWLMVNILCHADILEYGTSPRYGWLTPKGKLLKEFVESRSVDNLYQLVNVDQDYIHCYPDHCNCKEAGAVECNNPLF